jgi:hypothetical protein
MAVFRPKQNEGLKISLIFYVLPTNIYCKEIYGVNNRLHQETRWTVSIPPIIPTIVFVLCKLSTSQKIYFSSEVGGSMFFRKLICLQAHVTI